jgi:hypothetical protein
MSRSTVLAQALPAPLTPKQWMALTVKGELGAKILKLSADLGVVIGLPQLALYLQ